jgi:hypothetical protein
VQVISHQTVRLSRGKHVSPATGMCVMELASVLAGERFSDHPRSVCPVIAGLLRTYNDVVDDDHRQALIPYAAKVVDTRADADVQRARAQRCLEWGAAFASTTPWCHWRRRRLARRPPRYQGTGAACGGWAVEVLPRPECQSEAAILALVDGLIAMEKRAAAERPSDAPRLPSAA